MKSFSLAGLTGFVIGLVATAASGANITWKTPGTIGGPSDVNNSGVYFGSWAPGDANAQFCPVNGVNFNGWNDLPGLSYTNIANYYGGFSSPGTSNVNYNVLLETAAYASNTNSMAISWNGMTPGNTYLVEIWIHDGRNLGGTRWARFTGGTSTSGNVYYGSDGSGRGQFIVGTFVADSSGAQTVVLALTQLL